MLESPDDDDDSDEESGADLEDHSFPKAKITKNTSQEFINDIVRVVHQFCRDPAGRAANTLFSYNQMRTEGNMNYARILYLSTLLTKSAMKVMPELEEIAETNDSWPVRMIIDTIKEGFERLCFMPVTSTILDGNSQTFIETLHIHALLMANYQRNKIAKSYFLQLMSAHRMVTDRTDLGNFYFGNAEKSNDVLVELMNAGAVSMHQEHGSPTLAAAERAPIKFQVKHQFMRDVNEFNETGTHMTSSKNRGEVVKQLLRVDEKAEAIEDGKVVQAWMIGYAKRLAHSELRGDLEDVDSIAGMLSNGMERMCTKVIPDLEKYINKERRLAAVEASAKSGDGTAIYRCYLNTFNNSHLQLVLLARGLPFSYPKEDLVDKVSKLACKEEFNAFFVDNKLINEEAIESKARELKAQRLSKSSKK